MDFNDIEDFSGTGTYEYNPRAKRKPYSVLAANAQAKLPNAAAPVAAPSPAAAAKTGAGKTQETPPAEDRGDMRGYGRILQAMNSPEAWAASMEAGTAPNEQLSQNFMKMGAPRNIPYGGKMSWAEAAADGLKTGLGTYGYLKAQEAKASALRKYGDLFKKMDNAGGMGTLSDVTNTELPALVEQGNANAIDFWKNRG